MNLYMFYIGGDCKNSNIELHDVRFSIGETPEDCYADLRRQWWGDAKSLHLDSWGAVTQADGYDVNLSTEPYHGAEKLFFLNLGGYNGVDFEELHRNILVVAENGHAAALKGLQTIKQWKSPHRDAVLEVEKAICINDLFEQSGHYINLSKAETVQPFKFTSRYLKIGM